MSTEDEAAPRRIQCKADAGFFGWLESAGRCLAVTTYQGGKLMFISWSNGQATFHARSFERAMGLDVQDDSLVLATRTQIHWFANAPLLAPDSFPGQPGRYDALYLPRCTYHTGDIFAHDLAINGEGACVVNTRFSCLCDCSRRFSFEPVWQPPFVTDLTPDDRCHLNGLAMRDDQPAYVTALGNTDTPRGWRPAKADGGIVMDIASGETILQGLCMPHSPRWHDDALWLVNSGKGELLRLDPSDGCCRIVATLPGYLRGLAFADDMALVGLCKIREKRIFGGLPVEAAHKELRCGVALVDTVSGEMAGFFEFTDGVDEIYDICLLPNGIRRPNLITAEQAAEAESFTAPEFSCWLRMASDPSQQKQ